MPTVTKFSFLILCLFACLGHPLTAQPADQLIGKWQDVKHPEKKIEIYRL